MEADSFRPDARLAAERQIFAKCRNRSAVPRIPAEISDARDQRAIFQPHFGSQAMDSQSRRAFRSIRAGARDQITFVGVASRSPEHLPHYRPTRVSGADGDRREWADAIQEGAVW